MGCSFERLNSIAIINALQTILNESSHKPSKIWVSKEDTKF